MGDEAAKAARRRSGIPAFTESYLVGSALDVGAGGDGLSKHRHLFPKLTDVRDWDLQDGDGQLLLGVADESLDVVHSSHCLEHLRDVGEALTNWWRVLKPGGHLVVVVPDWELYEGKVWPSTFNNTHVQRFTTKDGEPEATKIPDDLKEYLPQGEWLKVELLEHTMPPNRTTRSDWSTLSDCEPAIEFVVRKPEQGLISLLDAMNPPSINKVTGHNS